MGRRSFWLIKAASITLGIVLTGVAAEAVINWFVGLTDNISGLERSAR